MAGQTTVSIVGGDFHLNGEPTYPGRTWRGHRVEGLLLNSRMVQGAFDDLNPETRGRWSYPAPQAGPWDAERNTREFIEAMPAWRAQGLLAFTINFQGGSPQGYSKEQPWHNSAFDADGKLRPAYAERMGRILDRADELGMAVILGYFYFGQDERLRDETAVLDAVDHATGWLLGRGDTHVLVEVNNECDLRYDHAVLRPPRVHELIERVQRQSEGRVASPAGRLLVSTSFSGATVPGERVVAASDFVLLHGNGVDGPARLRALVDATRAVPTYRGQPVVFNEDDHFDFDQPDHHFAAAVEKHASWGYFDFRKPGEPFEDGYQSVPVDWSIGSARKRAFFGLVRDMAGAGA